MELTGKCKYYFEKWLFDNPEHQCEKHLQRDYIRELYNLPDSMKYSLFVDFFDEKDIRLELTKLIAGWVFFLKGESDFKNRSETRSEARVKAIKTANDIYNETINYDTKTSI